MVECPECGQKYERISQHWRWNKDHIPDLTDKQYQVIVGSLMGDGSISESNKNFTISMTSENYLHYINNLFPYLCSGVKMQESAEKNARKNRESGFDPEAKEENYSDMYRATFRKHPKISKLCVWYSSGEKVWPEDIELTPTVLKHWYIGDGHYNNKSTSGRIEISLSNEKNNLEKVFKYFSNKNLPTPSNYSRGKRTKGRDGENCYIYWTVKDSKKLFKYMGEPLPDFEYKWPEEHRQS